jgi:23S rRNA (guanosine2251-2'-O)-methyltransferase
VQVFQKKKWLSVAYRNTVALNQHTIYNLAANTVMIEKLSLENLQRVSASEFKQQQKFEVIAVLENIRSAYNVGSVFRTADAFAIEAVYITGYTCTPPHKEIKKTALGAEETVAWQHFANADAAIAQLKTQGYKVFAIEQIKNSIMLHKTSFSPTEKIALVFGNEVSGVEASTIALCDGCIEIPQFGTKHSLNVATAAGVILWDLVKPRV